DLYKGLNIINGLLKEINNVVKDDLIINKKINETIESFTNISTNIAEAHALKQNEELAAWAKSSTNMAWNLGSRLLGLEWAQNHIQSSMSSLKEDTHTINTMMTEMYAVFKGQSIGSVTPTLALTHILANVKGIMIPTLSLKILRLTPRRRLMQIGKKSLRNLSTQLMPTLSIATDEQVEDQRKLVKASFIIRLDLDALIPYTINREVYYLTAEQLQAHMDKEEKIKKAEEEAKLFAISKPEVIKDAEHEVLKRQHIEKVIKSLELKKHKYDNYMWTISKRLKPKTITDIKIYPKTKPVVITVFRGTDGRNFDVHKPFAFSEFGISELNEPREIIPRKKNAVLQDLMNSLSRRKKRKHMELEPEIKILGLECNRALPENVLFVNNMVIEELEHGIFFTDEFGNQAFQRWNDIDKVRMEALVSYRVAGFMV
nr:copia protein [Tanacetum cinerariifolium]